LLRLGVESSDTEGYGSGVGERCDMVEKIAVEFSVVILLLQEREHDGMAESRSV
jgi:hypothetical protein